MHNAQSSTQNERTKNMGLNIGGTGGDFDPFAKYNAKAGRWYVKGDDGEVEVQNPTFVADFANIKTGWFHFMEGQAPSRVYDESLSAPAKKPDENHKRGFEMRLFSEQSFGGVVQFGSVSMIVCNAVNELYNQYEADVPKNAGKLPVVQCTGTEAQKGKFGTNYKPVFSIVKWVERPAALEAGNTNAATAPEAVAAKKAAVSEF